MRLLALDIGLRNTGVAFGETKSGIVMALSTLHHDSESELAKKILSIVQSKEIDHLIIGLPLLPNGAEGEQASLVRKAATSIENVAGLKAEFLDERYTTNIHRMAQGSDPDATAACALLTVKMDQKNHIDI